jgi:hypothetical protein
MEGGVEFKEEFSLEKGPGIRKRFLPLPVSSG